VNLILNQLVNILKTSILTCLIWMTNNILIWSLRYRHYATILTMVTSAIWKNSTVQ